MKQQRSFMKGDFTIAKENASKGWNMPYMHLHNSYEIYILISGNRTVRIDDKKYSVGSGDVTLFNKNIPHRSYGETAYSGICIKFRDYYLDMYFSSKAQQELMACFDYPVIHLKPDNLLYMQSIADNFNETAPYNFTLLSNILSILNQSCCEYTTTENSEKSLLLPNNLYRMLTITIPQY